MQIPIDAATVAEIHGPVLTAGEVTLTIRCSHQVHVNIAVGLYLLKRSMPSLQFGTSISFEPGGLETRSIEMTVSNAGPYALVLVPHLDPPAIALPSGDVSRPGSWPPFNPDRPYTALWVSEGEPAPDDIQMEADRMLQAQTEYTRFELRDAGYTGSQHMIVHVVLQGCMLDHRQPIEGGWIAPLAKGLGPESMLASINSLLEERGVSFTLTDHGQAIYRQARPLAMVSFSNVVSSDDAGALRAINDRLTVLVASMAMDRGGAAKALAFIIEGPEPDALRFHPSSEIYEGNLVGGFVSGQITDYLDRMWAASRVDPWILFAANLYREILAEKVLQYRLFKAWSLVEAAAKRRRPQSDVPVVNDDGLPMIARGSPLTGKRDLGRVIMYLRDVNDGLGYAPGQFSADDIQSAYFIRNKVAHEGGVNLASWTPASSHEERARDFYANMGWLKVQDWARAVIRYELAQLTG